MTGGDGAGNKHGETTYARFETPVSFSEYPGLPGRVMGVTVNNGGFVTVQTTGAGVTAPVIGQHHFYSYRYGVGGRGEAGYPMTLPASREPVGHQGSPPAVSMIPLDLRSLRPSPSSPAVV